MKDLLIGFDIGTSSLKLIVLNVNNKIELELTQSTDKARIESENSLFNEQNVDALNSLMEDLFNKIPNELYSRVKSVQCCGQMHGIVLWNTSDATKIHSNLVTWQDLRCDSVFLAKLPVKSISDLNSGYGCATLIWYVLNRVPLDQYNASGTIQDYFSYLKNLKQFPFEILPKVCHPGTIISDSINIYGRNLPNVSVFNSLGDLQCSVYSCLEDINDCVINISTSSQVCVAVDKTKYESVKNKLPKSVTIYPYFNNQVLLVAASLNGGNVLDNFVRMIYSWNHDLKLNSTNTNIDEFKEVFWANVIKLASDYSERERESKLTCKPTLFGERHDKSTFASFQNISIDNLSIGEVFNSICIGLVANLQEMFPCDLLKNDFGVKRIIGTGKALVMNPIMRKQLERQFGLPVNYNKLSDAALGAALFAKEISD